MTPSRVGRFAFALVVLRLIGCSNPAGPTVDDVLTEQARWSTEAVTAYSYDYQETGFFICCTKGQTLTLQVRNDTVVSAVFAGTGQPVPQCPPSCPGATIDRLFERAIQAARNGALSGIVFDRELHYPTRIDLAGPPDASGSEFAAHLKPSL